MRERLKNTASTATIIFLLLLLLSWVQERDARASGECGAAPGHGHAHQ